MTLPASGAISFNNINVELGVSGTTQASLGQASYRTLAGVPSGAISMSNFYGKANAFAFTISSNQTNANLRTLAVNAGWNQSTKVIATIGSGVYISSNSTGTPALTINGAFPGGVELVNSGTIVGMGGNGGSAATYQAGSSGSAGGLGLSVSVAVTITNNSTIAGGGGGGGGGGTGGSYYGKGYAPLSGGGGGGGRSSNAANSSGGPVTYKAYGEDTASAGGSGTVSSAGSGGNGGANPYLGLGRAGGNGGAGGGWGSNGSGGGGGIGSFGPSNQPGGSGGGAGGAIFGNSNITWVATGTRLGPIS